MATSPETEKAHKNELKLQEVWQSNIDQNENIPCPEIKMRPIEIWWQKRSLFHQIIWQRQKTQFEHNIDYEHFRLIYLGLEPVLNNIHNIPPPISQEIAAYSTGFFDECDECKTPIHIFFEDGTFNATYGLESFRYHHSRLNVACLCEICKKITITIKTVGPEHNLGNDIYFKIKKCTKLGKLMDACAAKLGVDIDTLHFSFDGTEIHNEMTTQDLRMKNDDCIDVRLTEIDETVDSGNDQRWNWEFWMGNNGASDTRKSCNCNDAMKQQEEKDLDNVTSQTLKTRQLELLSIINKTRNELEILASVSLETLSNINSMVNTNKCLTPIYHDSEQKQNQLLERIQQLNDQTRMINPKVVQVNEEINILHSDWLEFFSEINDQKNENNTSSTYTPEH